MPYYVELEPLDGEGKIFVNPEALAAIAPAYKPSTIKPGTGVLAGTMLIFSGGANLPVSGTPISVRAKLEGN